MTVNPIFVPQSDVRLDTGDTFRWATVTDVDPVRIRLDGDANGLPVEPDSLVFPTQLTIGSRVWVQFFGRRLLVLGKAGGVLEDTGWLDLSFTTANFTNYAGDAANAPRIRRFGKIVYFEGQAAPTTTGVANMASSSILSGNQMAVVPQEFWPVGGSPTWVCQGSSQNKWALRVMAGSGLSYVHRYGPDAPSTAVWLPFNVTWMVD